MAVVFPEVRIGEPVRYQALSVFPLFAEPSGDVEYALADEAIAKKSVTVEEVSEDGSVPELLVENKGDTRVLFIEGEELVGAKQNRILNTSVLIGAKSKIKIPVSCVEQGRWSYKSRNFESSGSHSSSKLRHALKRSVNASAKAAGSHRSDQGKIWQECEMLLSQHRVESASSAMSAAFAERTDEISDYRSKLKYVAGATGVAVAIGKQVVGLDMFDKPQTCERIWDRLLSGCIMDAIAAHDVGSAEIADVETLIQECRKADWQPVKPVGEGEEHRADFRNDHASALSWKGTLVHESVVAS